MFGNNGSSNLETLRYNTLVKKLQQPSPLFTLKVCHLHHPLSNSTASEFTTKLWSGWVLMMLWMLLEWRWKVDNNQIMVPIMTDMKAAPDNPLKMIHCNCESCPPHCNCRRYVLPCHAGCG